MNCFIVNGKFMSERMQGIVRYAREILNELDKIINDSISVELVVPRNAVDIPIFENIRIRQVGKHTGLLWEQLDLGGYVKKNKEATLINLCNVSPFFVRPGVTAVHDIMYKVNPEHYTKLRNRISRYWHMLQYTYIFRHEKKIITVSEFSKNDIEKWYPVAKGKIVVIPDGWQHVLEYKASDDWRERYPFLKPGEFYFSLATLSKNKNGKWIMKVAEKNPAAVFAMGGKIYETEDCKKPDNVHLLGFVTDEDACALMKNCKAFLFPSVYEGFGIPPLEALAQGAQVISSNATSLPEVLGNSVHYIDPCDPDIDLDQLLKEHVECPEAVLSRFGWDKSAKDLYNMIIDL